ncbi:hypothetical protein LTR37_013125 [Vermiconidia calcicola]|uniref:Uncharacterized protein n=1 Tax=Vermiconidia calcicola TaxID=1690605 RepID=A0ACC3MXD7_9PEZI|nr:hypothetical protein LTR37_013125 [Vermiconidia calcicola]
MATMTAEAATTHLNNDYTQLFPQHQSLRAMIGILLSLGLDSKRGALGWAAIFYQHDL